MQADREEVVYDPACARIDTAIKAMWLLYRRGKTKLLAEWLLMDKREVESRFLEFDLRYIQSESGRITSEKQVFRLLRLFNEMDERGRIENPLLGGALFMVTEYQQLTRRR